MAYAAEWHGHLTRQADKSWLGLFELTYRHLDIRQMDLLMAVCRSYLFQVTTSPEHATGTWTLSVTHNFRATTAVELAAYERHAAHLLADLTLVPLMP